MIFKAKLTKIESGWYSYKNGVDVKHEGKQWNVYQFDKLIYSSDTLSDCKLYIAWKC